MTTRTTRLLGALLVAAATVALAMVLPAMARRIRAHNIGAEGALHRIGTFQERAFEIDGESVRIEEVGTEGEDARRLEVSWRGETIPLVVQGPVDDRLPDLARYSQWLRALLVSVGHRPADEQGPREVVEEPARLVIALRTPGPAGPDGRESINRKEWMYEILLLLPAGAPEPEALPEPSLTRTNAYGRPASTPPVSRFERGGTWAKWTFNMAALPEYERTWQYAAAIEATPPLLRPRNMFLHDGVGALAWTWPAAGVSLLGLLVGVLLLISTLVRRDDGRGVAGGGRAQGASA